jgi:hypothetical protein
MATLHANATPALNRPLFSESRQTLPFAGIEVSVIVAAALLWLVLVLN